MNNSTIESLHYTRNLRFGTCVKAAIGIVGFLVICIGGFAILQVPRQVLMSEFHSLENGRVLNDIVREHGSPYLDIRAGESNPILKRAGKGTSADQRVLVYQSRPVASALAFLYFDESDRLKEVTFNTDD